VFGLLHNDQFNPLLFTPSSVHRQNLQLARQVEFLIHKALVTSNFSRE
jgi:hypothetical protein